MTNITAASLERCQRLPRLMSTDTLLASGLQAGEICAMFGLDCASGDTFTSGAQFAMTSIRVPEPVVSLAVTSDTQNVFKVAQHTAAGPNHRCGSCRLARSAPCLASTAPPATRSRAAPSSP